MNPRLSPSPLITGTTGGNELSVWLEKNGRNAIANFCEMIFSELSPATKTAVLH